MKILVGMMKKMIIWMTTFAPDGTDTPSDDIYNIHMTEFRQPLQAQSHLEVPRILVQLGHIQRT